MANSYDRRDKLLKQLGYKNYLEYLSSDLWKELERLVLKRAKWKCECCGSEATEVHHRVYSLLTLLGERTDTLVALCNNCHKQCEFDGEIKKTLVTKINDSLANMTVRNQNKLRPGLCHKCCRNPTKKTKAYCGRCVRDFNLIDED